MPDVFIDSEFKRLREVLIHAPGREHDAMRPAHLVGNTEHYLLFEDLIVSKRARAEHAELRRILGAVAKVVDVADMVDTVLRDRLVRAEVISRVVEIEGLDRAAETRLRDLDVDHLARTFLTGISPQTGETLFAPAPNLLFARDLGAILGRSICLCNAAKIGVENGVVVRPRQRETYLTEMVFRHHPRFAGSSIIDINRGGEHDLALEGGDIVVCSEHVLAVGCGERTEPEAVNELARQVLGEGIFEAVLRVAMPPERSCMHLDTIFSFLDVGECVYHAPLIDPGGRARVHVDVLRLSGGQLKEEAAKGLFEALEGQGVHVRGIKCGGDDPLQQEREQWMDASNAFVLAPGIVLAYGWNEATLAELGEAGYEAVTPEEFIRNARYRLAKGLKTTILVNGPELSKARGGPRCLSMPLVRG